MYKNTLMRQFVSIILFIFGIIFISLGLLFPQVLLPVYEQSVYTLLKQPLEVINSNFDDTSLKSNVAFLYVVNGRDILASANLNTIISLTSEQVASKITDEYGKFVHSGKTYYYNTSADDHVIKVAITNDSHIINIKRDILNTIFPILIFTFILVLGIIILWSRQIIKKIEHLKVKVDNLDNDNYVDKYNYRLDDELKSLSESIDKVKHALKEQEDYKNQMYQNISHDFKTPITVIKSYIEGIEDGIQDEEAGFEIIKDQVKKLEQKVHSLLYLNKLNYIQESNHYTNETTDVAKIAGLSIEKFKLQRPDCKFEIHIEDNNAMFRGTDDMWEAIIDNLLGNFVRYANNLIKITIKNNRIILYNDGSNVEPDILNDIFTPYKKSINGQFGLGLSIVKKTVNLVGYEVSFKNEKEGVTFTIK